jgi:hypothetical protein
MPPATEHELRAATPSIHPYFQLYDGSVVLWGATEAVSRRARQKKYTVSPIWVGGGNVLTPVFFSREWRYARTLKDTVKGAALYPAARSFYDGWLRKPFRRLRRALLS